MNTLGFSQHALDHLVERYMAQANNNAATYRDHRLASALRATKMLKAAGRLTRAEAIVVAMQFLDHFNRGDGFCAECLRSELSRKGGAQ